MGKKFGDFAVGLSRQTRQDILQISKGIVAIEFGGLDQAHDGGGAFAGAQAIGEEPILAAERDGPDTVLDPVVVDRYLSIVKIMDQGRPALETVKRDCACKPLTKLIINLLLQKMYSFLYSKNSVLSTFNCDLEQLRHSQIQRSRRRQQVSTADFISCAIACLI